VSTAVGYTGGTVEHPTYEMVCGGKTGHAEAVLVEFDPKKIAYKDLLKAFWENHSPAFVRKGQYRSAVFTFDAEQASLAEQSRLAVEGRLQRGIPTEIKPAETFWLAEDYHQQYFDKTGVYACPSH
jgi:peptide-methionine (S)-S-oxide reductase